MDFIQAVQELKDGKCEGIQQKGKDGMAILNAHNNEFGNVFALVWKHTDGHLSHLSTFHVSGYLNDWELVNPKPQMETVEVKFFVALDDKNTVHCIQRSTPLIESYVQQVGAEDLLQIVELTGTYQREVKPKVKRREEIELVKGLLRWSDGVDMGREGRSCPINATFYAEWEE